jgi:hypothetical protein
MSIAATLLTPPLTDNKRALENRLLSAGQPTIPPNRFSELKSQISSHA